MCCTIIFCRLQTMFTSMNQMLFRKQNAASSRLCIACVEESTIVRKVSNCSIGYENEYFQIHLHFHINASSVNGHLAMPLQSSTCIKHCCSLFCQEKNGNMTYDKDLEMKIYPVIKPHQNRQACSMLECLEEHTEFNGAKDKNGTKQKRQQTTWRKVLV